MAKDQNSVNSATKVSNELHELLTEDDLSVVETQFQVKQVLRHGITVEEFVEIILDTIPTKVGMSTEKIGSVFAKIDVHSTGLIDWNAFISYILTSLQRDKAATLSTDKSLQTTFRVLNGPNRDIIMRIDMMPQIDEKTGEMIYSTCRFVTASRDGVLAVWTQKWNLQKFKVCRENFSEITRRKVFPWILDMVCLPNVQMIATCSTDDRIRFYDSTNAGMDLIFALIEFEAIATCLDFWFDLNNNEHSFLIIGDSKGGVLFLEFYKSLSEKLFGLHGYGTNFVKLSDIFKKQNKFVKGTYYSKQHDEWVRKVKYINELKSIFSCSISSTKSMLVFGVLLETGHKVFVVEKGISSFDYSSRHNIIVSGSIDRCLRIWNPYVNKKPVATLTGHSAPVLHVMIIDEQFLCISLSEDKCIKVWDLKEQSCVQTIFDRAFKWGNQKVYSAMYDPFHRQLLLGSMKLIVFEQVWQAETTDKTIFTTHTHPLLGVVYSNVYNYVISASEIGKVIFWDLESGEKKVQISLTHTQIVDGIEVQMAITAMSLDGNSRRLFTAGGDGFLKMWSMTNGSFLKSIHLPEGKDINSIIACKNRIFFGGWTKRVYVCNEELHLETMRTWAVQHTDDIMEICHILPDYISTASWDGKIVMWMLETGQALSVWSLHHQFLFNYMPKLQTLVQLKFIESQTLDFLAAELDRDSDQFENAEHLMASVKTKMRKKAQGSHSTRDYLRSEISFPALNCMVTLTTRYDKPPVGNLFVADTDGFIQLWSVSRQGGLISLFANVSVIENYTSCMTIDAAEKYLFTGDTIGYIRVWYIKYYYSGESQPPLDKLNIETRPFPFSSKRLQPVRERVLKELTILKPKKHLAFANFNCPHLISSFRGHLKSIVKITILEKKKLILSASKDKSVRIWTYSGAYLRTIGDSRQWSLELALSTPVLPMDRKVPMDISRVASGPTLQVILQGVSPQWYRTREIILCTYVKSVRRKIDTPLPTVNVKDEEVRLRSEAERKHALEMKFSKMGSPLGEYFAFKPYERDKPSLPTVPDIFKEMNCVYAYLECQPPCTISLEPAHKYLESHRYSTRLKMSKSTYEHAKVVL